MTALHAYFTLRNQQAFQRLLDAPKAQTAPASGPSTSGGKSWSRPSPLSSAFTPAVDVNARDWLGRTVLHLAASASDASAPEYVRLLLAHPSINVNLADKESHWTPLHRALFHGNIATAVLLLQRPDIDTALKDLEGYTAFDLYNSTVEGTKPELSLSGGGGEKNEQINAELFTWGTNRNATLGVGDGDDRAFPEQISIEPAQELGTGAPVTQRFRSIRVQQIAMSKLHSAAVTDERRANVRVCGFGSGGRLGAGQQHSQYTLTPVPALAPSQRIVFVALGQDHTLALTDAGEVLSWGLNRFSQLGYTLERDSFASSSSGLRGVGAEDGVQATPRKVSSGLRGKVVRGVAACKTASACWTEREVWTWGTNGGQLGYDKAAQPVQVLPRVVSKISQPVISVTITDTAMACLLETNDVVCIYNDNHFRVNFPPHAFPSEMTTYRPPHANRNVIEKITSADSVFAALSSNGELFTFSLPAPTEGATTPGGKARELVRPQRVWALRKKFSSVKDVALGADGAIIICTESGHVFVRERSLAGLGLSAAVSSKTKATKFQRVPGMQRVVRVAANNTGAYGALRVDAVPTPLVLRGNSLAEDLALVLPFGSGLPDTRVREEMDMGRKRARMTIDGEIEVEGEDEDDRAVLRDRAELVRLCEHLDMHRRSCEKDKERGKSEAGDPSADSSTAATPTPLPARVVFDGTDPIHGADVIIHVRAGSEPRIRAHRVVLAARSGVLAGVLAGHGDFVSGGIRISLSSPPLAAKAHEQPQAPWKHPLLLSIHGCHPLSILILLTYLYSDNLLALWDWRVADSAALAPYVKVLKVEPRVIKAELQRLAEGLGLRDMRDALEGAFKREVKPAVGAAFASLVSGRSAAAADVVLCLADKEVPCHSAVLRARSPFFRAFFDEDAWTVKRWEEGDEGVVMRVRVMLRHLKWRSMEYVVRYLYGGDAEMFDVLDDVHSVEQLIEFMFDVMAAANELLLDRLVQICSSVILAHVNITNACSVLSDASFFHAQPLVRSVQGYMAQNMETLLESRELAGCVDTDLVRALAGYVREEQKRKAPITRSGVLIDLAMDKGRAWLELQDVPGTIVPSTRSMVFRDKERLGEGGVKLSPPLSMMKKSISRSPEASPVLRPLSQVRPGGIAASSNRNSVVMPDDGIFMMDGMDGVPPISLAQDASTSRLPDVQAKQEAAAGKVVSWKVASAPRVDMKAIMAEAESKASTSAVRPAPPVSGHATTGYGIPHTGSSSEVANWRQSKPTASDGQRTPGASPWKMQGAQQQVAPSTPLRTPQRTPPRTPLMKPVRMGDEGGIAPRSQPPTPQRPGMGPVFTPSRQQPIKSLPSAPSVRRTSSSAAPAWTLPPVQPTVQSTPSTSTMSFAAIQLAQQEQLAPRKKDRRSLMEIQEEERARQVEEDFMRWWAAEEERLRVEEGQQAQPSQQQGGAAQKRTKRKEKKAGEKAKQPERREELASAIPQDSPNPDKEKEKRDHRQRHPHAVSREGKDALQATPKTDPNPINANDDTPRKGRRPPRPRQKPVQNAPDPTANVNASVA